MNKKRLRKRAENGNKSMHSTMAPFAKHHPTYFRSLLNSPLLVIRGALCIVFAVFSLIWRLSLSKYDSAIVLPGDVQLESTNSHTITMATSLQEANDLLLQPPVSIRVQPQPEWLAHDYNSSIAVGYPIREVRTCPQYCPNDEDFTRWIRTRTYRWYEVPDYLQQEGIWQKALTDKIGGYLFARHMGVQTPSILYCTSKGPSGLQDYQPLNTTTSDGFVVKNMNSHSSKNVYVLPHGFGGINSITQRNMTLEDVQQSLAKANATDIYMEEIIASSSDASITVIPDDYKFYTFNGVVESVRVVRNRGTDRACMAFYDANYKRQDTYGCFSYTPNKPKGNRTDPITGCIPILLQQQGQQGDASTRRLCSDVPPPVSWERMLQTARRLGERIGIFMRIDLFENAQHQVVLGELTPFCSYGGYHCTSRVTGGCVDACFLGRAWKEHSLHNTDQDVYKYKEGWWKRKDGKMVERQLPRLEGGPITSEPEYLKGWDKLRLEEKCDRIRQTKLL